MPAASRALEHDGDLERARRFFKEGIGRSDDFRTRDFRLGGPAGPGAMLLYFEGMVDEQAVDERIIEPAMRSGQIAAQNLPDAARILEQSLTSRADVKRTRSLQTAEQAVMDAEVCLVIEGCPDLLVLDAVGFPMRGIGQPGTEHAVRGSREGFTEVIIPNLTMIRRRIKDRNLRVKFLRIGTRSGTWVAILYLDGTANPAVVEEVHRRLKAIPIDHVQGIQTLEEFLVDHPSTPFPRSGPRSGPTRWPGRSRQARWW